MWYDLVAHVILTAGIDSAAGAKPLSHIARPGLKMI
jgi:hypothetical protein